MSADASNKAIRVNDDASVRFDAAADGFRMAHYADGDIYLDLAEGKDRREVSCDVGMATGAALFRLEADQPRELEVSVGLEPDMQQLPAGNVSEQSWSSAMEGTAQLQIPDERMQFLYDAAVKTILLLSADDLIPGPYTYRRFWFRDACLMLHPLLAINQVERAERVLGTFPGRQTAMGYFLSQEGEWDSNGQVLWIAARFAELTGRELSPDLRKALRKAVRWLERKRLPAKRSDGTAGLLPAGFSAEHLGPNDYYYWDDFWAWGGLEAMARHWQRSGDADAAEEASALAEAFAGSIRASIDQIPDRRARGAIPAAPGRRLDAGAIGSMVADYPLQLFPPGDERMMKTAGFLIGNCFHQGGFFQEMIHSGINAYLSLDLAQTLLRAGDPGYADIIRRVAELATPTGQWPEAIHPLTLGGCMGDGQHGWAAAEWIMMLRNCFVREEADHLVIGSGILPEWLEAGSELRFGPSLTAWGPVTVRVNDGQVFVEGAWREEAPRIVDRRRRLCCFRNSSFCLSSGSPIVVMNILFFTNTYVPHVGGVAKSVQTLEESFRARGHEVRVIAPEFEGAEDDPDVLRVPAFQNFNGSDFSVRIPIPNTIWQFVEDFGADIVHSHHPFLLGDAALRVAAAGCADHFHPPYALRALYPLCALRFADVKAHGGRPFHRVLQFMRPGDRPQREHCQIAERAWRRNAN